MRHHDKNRKFGRETGLRRALLSGLAQSLILKGKIRTTLAKAKSLRPVIERLITYAKKDDRLTAGRALTQNGLTRGAQKLMLEKIGPNYKDRHGGYTRISKLPARKSDSAKMAIIEFV